VVQHENSGLLVKITCVIIEKWNDKMNCLLYLLTELVDGAKGILSCYLPVT